MTESAASDASPSPSQSDDAEVLAANVRRTLREMRPDPELRFDAIVRHSVREHWSARTEPAAVPDEDVLRVTTNVHRTRAELRAAPVADFEGIVRTGAREFWKQRIDASPAPAVMDDAVRHTLTMLHTLNRTLDRRAEPLRARRHSGAVNTAVLRARKNRKQALLRDFLTDFGLVILTAGVITTALFAIVNDSVVIPRSLRPARVTLAASMNDPGFATGTVVLLAFLASMAVYFFRDPHLRRWVGRSLGAVSAAALLSVGGVAYLGALRDEVKLNRDEFQLREIVLLTLGKPLTPRPATYEVAPGVYFTRTSTGCTITKKTDAGGMLIADVVGDRADIMYDLDRKKTPRGGFVLGELEVNGQRRRILGRQNQSWIVKAGMLGGAGDLVIAEVEPDGSAKPVASIPK
jgi:hypothetical protein